MATSTRKKRRPSRALRGLPTVTPYSPAADRLDNLKVDVIKIGLYAAGASVALGGLWLAKNHIEAGVEKKNKEEATAQVTNLYSPSYYADRLQAAFNPSGFTSLSDFDGTDVTGVMNVVNSIGTQAQLVLVAQAFYKLTSTALVDKLRQELNATEYQKFWAAINKKPKK